MKIPLFSKKLELYKNANPNLSYEQVGLLLLIDNLYLEIPKDITEFRHKYPHLDPHKIDNPAAGITFIKIAKSKEPTSVIKHRLNSYINIKYNYLGNFKSYEENMKRFKEHCKIITKLIDDILERGGFPNELIELLREHPKIRECTDFYDMLCLFKETNDPRIKFEIIRKIGLIVILTRINRKFLIDEIDSAIEEVKKVFSHGLGLLKQEKHNYYLWIDENNSVSYSNDFEKAQLLHNDATKKRSKRAIHSYPLQIFEYTPYRTYSSTEIIHFEARNKLRYKDTYSYSSVIEKMIRKNLEFPYQVNDMIGVKIILRDENQIPQLIQDIETFLGGSSTRKKEKNSLHKFGKRELGQFSSKDYFVWKAIYDIALPHPSIQKIKKMIELTKGKKYALRELKKRINYFKDRPKDFVAEVQLQDLNSFLLSIAKGSPTDHQILKMNQIRSNSFYKFFPKEIYQQELNKLRNDILNINETIL